MYVYMKVLHVCLYTNVYSCVNISETFIPSSHRRSVLKLFLIWTYFAKVFASCVISSDWTLSTHLVFDRPTPPRPSGSFC